jgi:cytidylate kinase
MSTVPQKRITIAIDGYSSCGKSTLAKALAEQLNYVFIDSGAMYRGIAWYAIHHQLISTSNQLLIPELIAQLPGIHVSFGPKNKDGVSTVIVNNIDVTEQIRTIEVSSWVSQIAAIKEVRKAMVQLQQKMGENGGVIMDGRDIGSVVFPHAELKLFITASPAIRAQRRYKEMQAKGESVTLEEIAENLAHRDYLDTTRSESPLIQVEDAVVIDNSELNQIAQLEIALNLVFAKLNA